MDKKEKEGGLIHDEREKETERDTQLSKLPGAPSLLANLPMETAAVLLTTPIPPSIHPKATTEHL